MRIVVASNRRKCEIRARIIEMLKRLGHEVEDAGIDETSPPTGHLEIATAVGRKVSQGEADRGILIGATGLGMAIVANKFPGVRAAVCHDELLAEMSRRQIDLNVLCLPADLASERMISLMIRVWLSAPFEGGRYASRIEEIAEAEHEACAPSEEAHGVQNSGP